MNWKDHSDPDYFYDDNRQISKDRWDLINDYADSLVVDFLNEIINEGDRTFTMRQKITKDGQDLFQYIPTVLLKYRKKFFDDSKKLVKESKFNAIEVSKISGRFSFITNRSLQFWIPKERDDLKVSDDQIKSVKNQLKKPYKSKVLL
jgi:hypothetical protein